MIIDNGPAIRAFSEEMLKRLKSHNPTALSMKDLGKIEAFEMVVALCDGLTKQNEMMEKSVKV